jgi:hypothetical protein
MADTNRFNAQSFSASRPGDMTGSRSVQEDFTRIGIDLIDTLGRRAEEIVSEQKSRAASEIASLAAMLRNAAQCVDQSDRGTISDHANDFAGEIDRFANHLRRSSWRALAGDVEDFARRAPTLFMASSAIAGFFLGRLLMAPVDTGSTDLGRSGGTPLGDPVSRSEDSAVGGTLSATGAAASLGLPEEETR